MACNLGYCVTSMTGTLNLPYVGSSPSGIRKSSKKHRHSNNREKVTLIKQKLIVSSTNHEVLCVSFNYGSTELPFTFSHRLHKEHISISK